MTTTPTPHVHIECRRWFQRTYGNTYHSVRITHGDKQVAHVPFEYGYGEQCLQTAISALKFIHLIPQDEQCGKPYLINTLGATWEIVDVDRKRDL